MDEEKVYKYVTTVVGKAKLAAAFAMGVSVNLAYIAVGDGGGSEYDPDKSQTALKGEKWRGLINKKIIHPDDPNIVIVNGIIPPNVGGFFVREISLVDDDGDAIYIFSYASSYKPTPNSGISKDMSLELWIIVEDSNMLSLTADLNVCVATVGDLYGLSELSESETPKPGVKFHLKILRKLINWLTPLQDEPLPIAAAICTESGEAVQGAAQLENGDTAKLLIVPQ